VTAVPLAVESPAVCYVLPMPRPAPASAAPRSPGVALILLLLKAVWVAFVIATPVLGAWAASSLAAYSNGKVAITAAAGLLLFPGVPLLWEGWSALRRRGVPKPRVLTFGDRLILRTLAVNLLFLAGLLGTRPAVAFAALSTRGDWMLDGRSGARVDAVRHGLFRAADGLEWLYLAVHEDRFAQKDPDPPPAPSSTSSATPAPTPAPSSSGALPLPETRGGGTTGTEATAKWPLPQQLHPVVAAMPADAEASIESVAKYIGDRDSTQAGRLKAAHDWVADRIAYDGPAYVSRKFPPQDARTVFAHRTGVCAGYAQLLEALGKALGLEVFYVTGDARTDGQHETGESHAWNAARIDGHYVLIDATWDSGFLSGTTFSKGYRTDYYLTPAEVFTVDHFPTEARWQLRSAPLSRGDFFRQPMMTPRFYADHRELVSPTRSQVTVRGPVEIVMRAPPALFTLAHWSREGDKQHVDCAVARGELTRITCELPGPGAYSVEMFSNTQQYGSPYQYIGQIEANREP
jgi:Transglutaminase-like superfamily